MDRCWCGRPLHNDLIDGCVGDGFLRAMFGPPSLNTMIGMMVSAYGDLTWQAFNGDEEAAAVIAANPLPGPDMATDRAMLRAAGMNVSDDDIRALRAWYWPDAEETHRLADHREVITEIVRDANLTIEIPDPD